MPAVPKPDRKAPRTNTPTARRSLEPRREPYWVAAGGEGKGRYIGFRKMDAQRGSWIARARDQDNGKQQYHALGDLTATFDYDQACKAAREWFASLDAGVVVTKGPFTVEMACKRYVEDRCSEKGPACANDAEWRFKKSVYGTPFGRTEVTKLRAPALKKWREGLNMTPAGANRMMTSLRAALNLAVANKQVVATAAQEWRGVKQYKNADGRREIFLDLTQRRALMDATTDNVRDLIEAALRIGARPGELAKVTRGDFDARTKTVKLTHRKGDGTLKIRHVQLEGPTLALFERLAKSKLPGALLFMRDDGEPWTRMEWSRRIIAAAEEAKLPAGVCLYSCRHTYISQAIHDGLSLLDVARLTGTSLQMIEKHYGHIGQEAVRERLAKVQIL